MPKKGSIKLSDDNLLALKEAIMQSIPFGTACVLAGISEASFYAWRAEAVELEQAIAKGRRRAPRSDRGKRLLELLETIKRAKATAIKRNLLVISTAGKEPKHWTASAWILERLDPEQFGRNRLDITLKGGPSQMTLDKMIGVVMEETKDQPELRRRLAHKFDEIAKAEEADGETDV